MREYSDQPFHDEPRKVYLNKQKTRWRYEPNTVFCKVIIIDREGEHIVTTRRPEIYEITPDGSLLGRTWYEGKRVWVNVKEGA